MDFAAWEIGLKTETVDFIIHSGMGVCPDTKALIAVLVSHYGSYAKTQEEIYLTLVRVARARIAQEKVPLFYTNQ